MKMPIEIPLIHALENLQKEGIDDVKNLSARELNILYDDTIQLFYDEERNWFVDEESNVVINPYEYVSVEDITLFKLSREKYMICPHVGINRMGVEIYWFDRKDLAYPTEAWMDYDPWREEAPKAVYRYGSGKRQNLDHT